MQELINVSLRTGYRIFSFSISGRETDSSFMCLSGIDIIKEIIYALWQIPNFEIIKEVQDAIWDNEVDQNSPYSEIFQIIRTLKNVCAEKDLDDFLDKYGDIIFEKLRNQKIVLTIDNIQFYDNITIRFLEFFYKKAHITLRECYFKIIEIFNIDYIQPNSLAENHLIRLRNFEEHLMEYQLNGFKNANESISFLRHLLSPNIDLNNAELSKIVKSSGNNPFFLTQYVQYLVESNVLKVQNNYCEIVDPERFSTVLSEIPETIEQLLERKWENLCNIFDSELCLKLFSAIHFFGELDVLLAYNLGFSNNFLENLVTYKFIKYTTEKKHKIEFYHDNVEAFFDRRINGFTDKIFDFNCNLYDYIQEGSFQWYYLKIRHNEFLDEEEIFHYIDNGLEIFISPKQASMFYYAIYNLLLNTFETIKNQIQWMEYLQKICSLIRDTTGSENAIIYYKKAYEILKRTKNLKAEPVYFKWLIRFAEACDESGEIKYALKLLQEYLLQEKLLKDDKKYTPYILCELYNRLHVYQRHLCKNPCLNREQKQWLNKSIKIAKDNKLEELIYVNLSDEGYLYYCGKEQEEQLVHIWGKAVDFFEKHEIPQKTLNYYRKKVQLCMVAQNLEDALEYCDQGEQYIETGVYSYEKLFFRHWFSIAKTYCLVMNSLCIDKNKSKIEKQFEIVDEYQLLLKSPKRHIIYSIKMLYYIYIRKETQVLNYFQLSIYDLEKSTQKTHVEFFRGFIIDNMLMAMTLNHTYFSLLDHLDSELRKEISDKYYIINRTESSKKEKQSSVLQTKDCLYNLLPL